MEWCAAPINIYSRTKRRRNMKQLENKWLKILGDQPSRRPRDDDTRMVTYISP